MYAVVQHSNYCWARTIKCAHSREEKQHYSSCKCFIIKWPIFLRLLMYLKSILDQLNHILAVGRLNNTKEHKSVSPDENIAIINNH
jgi:hypothetical protein